MSQALALRLPSLDLLKGFVTVGRHLSITLAARELFLTQSAVSRQILALEDALACKLFVRSHRAIAFTAEGEALFRKAEPALRRLQEALEALQPGARPVTVTASVGVASLWLLPRLGGFQASYPEIDLRVMALNRVVDLQREAIDLAIRYCKPEDVPAGATLLFEESLGVVANPALGLARLTSAADFAPLVLLDYEDPQRPWLQWRNWLAAQGWADARPRSVVRFNQYDQVILAALGGQGVALGRLPLVGNQLDKGLLHLIATPEPPRPSGYAYWLLHETAKARPAVQMAAAWIREAALGRVPSTGRPSGYFEHALQSPDHCSPQTSP